ncbi:membrane protein [Spirochaetia bacterium]|nr:membrane protein [Spirochaetia bacterium]
MKKWYNYLWIAELLYLTLGIFNILFAWLGMIFFITPLGIAIAGGDKAYCNRYCGRGQLLGLLGEKLKLSRRAAPPKFLSSAWFRYGFLAFFMTMFALMIYGTVRVFTGAPLSQTVTLLWLFKLPWRWAEVGFTQPGIAQFAFGFFSVMLTSTILGLVTMMLLRPRSWCAYCPMGTMTQGICKLKHGKENVTNAGKSEEDCGIAEAAGE